MNAKKAKAIRRAAKLASLDDETHYMTRNKGTGRGTFVVVDCARAAGKQIKTIVKTAPKLPISVIKHTAIGASHL